MSLSVMAEEDISKEVTINLVCVPQTTTICTDDCNTYTEEQMIRRGNERGNRNLSIRKTRVYTDTYYSVDKGAGFERASFKNNFLTQVIDGDQDEDERIAGKNVIHRINLLNKEYSFSVWEKGNTDNPLVDSKYICEERKSLFD